MIIIHIFYGDKNEKSELYTDLYTFSTEKDAKNDKIVSKTVERAFC